MRAVRPATLFGRSDPVRDGRVGPPWSSGRDLLLTNMVPCRLADEARHRRGWPSNFTTARHDGSGPLSEVSMRNQRLGLVGMACGWVAAVGLASPGPRPGRGDAERHGRRPARAHQGPGVRRVRGPRAGHAGRGEDGRLPDRAVPQARPEARQPRRHLRPERAARRLPGPVRRGVVPGRRRHDRPEVPGRLGRRLPEPGARR